MRNPYGSDMFLQVDPETLLEVGLMTRSGVALVLTKGEI